jgi:hypothetical protein
MHREVKRRVWGLAAAASLSVCSSTAIAIPVLQLDIAGGTYDASAGVETVWTSAGSFTLYAYLTPKNNCGTSCVRNLLNDQYFVSVALTPATNIAGDYGTFTYNGNVVDVTADMVFGTPPLETNQNKDPNDLQSHSVFDTYFAEIGFYFDKNNKAAPVDVQDDAGLGPQLGSGMYFAAFDFDVSGLATGYDLHFDLYDEVIRSSGDIDVNKFAPFSHDAEIRRIQVPEPGSIALFGTGLILLTAVNKRTRNRSKD